LTKNLFGGMVKIARFAPVCMYTEEGGRRFFWTAWQLADGRWQLAVGNGDGQTAKT